MLDFSDLVVCWLGSIARRVLGTAYRAIRCNNFSSRLPLTLAMHSKSHVAIRAFSNLPMCRRTPPRFLPPTFLRVYRGLPPGHHVGSNSRLLANPVCMRSAEPKSVLRIQLRSVQPLLPINFVLYHPSQKTLPKLLRSGTLRFIPVGLTSHDVRFPTNDNVQLRLRPFFNVLKITATRSGHRSIPPKGCNNGLSGQLLRPPYQLFLPAFLPKTLFSVNSNRKLRKSKRMYLATLRASVRKAVRL